MATARSLKLSLDGKRQVDRALTDKAWGNDDLIDAVGVQVATVKNFRSGKAVEKKNFVKFCQALGLDWEQVAELGSPPAPNSGGTEPRSTMAENLQQNTNEAQEVQVQVSDTMTVGQTVNVYQGSAQEVTTVAFSTSSTVDEQKIRQHCREKILQNYSKIRLLSGQEIGVDQLYVDVWLLNRSPRTFQRSADKMLETFDLRNDRLGLGDRIQRNPGFDIANQETKLLILGKPGSGKTTFLKHLAIDWCNGKFRSNLIAVLIEFRQICDEEWSLLDAIGKELQIQDEKQVEVLLKNGKLLIVMDGFDEVSTQLLRTQVQSQLGKIANDYSKNCFIMTCRTQIMQRIPNGFTLVEVTDFNINQVQAFVHNWFRADGQDELSLKTQWQNLELALDENPALKELAVTPVLLGLICLVLQDEGEIPAQAGLLYERGIRLLLRKWNDDKAIDGWTMGTEAYQKLNIEQKEHLLINIAARKFENSENFVLFDQADLIKQISEYIGLSNQNDVLAVLKAIESQHGLLIERADELWSFSHLTFQEYFTTKWLLSLSLEKLAQKIRNERWQEVVQQIVKSQGQSDRLLRLIKRAIDYSIAHDGRLQEFLVWVLGKSQSITTPCNTGIRAFYSSPVFYHDELLSLNLNQTLDQACYEPLIVYLLDKNIDLERAHTLALKLEQVLEQILELIIELDHAHDMYFDYVHNYDLDLNYARDLDLDYIQALHCNLDLARNLFLDLKFDFNFDLDPEFINSLEQLREQLPQTYKSNNFGIWWKTNAQAWKAELQKTILKYRHVLYDVYDWQFTNDQQRLVQSYYDMNNFIIELLDVENTVSPEVRREIEDNLLIPIAELKRRLPDQYGS